MKTTLAVRLVFVALLLGGESFLQVTSATGSGAQSQPIVLTGGTIETHGDWNEQQIWSAPTSAALWIS